MWCVPEIDAEFIQRMEELLELYAKAEDPLEPVVCLDERPVQLLESERPGRKLRPGTIAKRDYEYVRKGTANIFCIVEPRSGRRLTHATPNRKGSAFARALKRIARRYQRARTIHLVMDNLNTHAEKSLRDHLGELEAKRLWKRFTVHYTPKHASWLNPAEMEASLVSRECLGKRRLGDFQTLRQEVATWAHCSDKERRRINWKWRVSDARRVFRYDGIATLRAQH
jgi:transposase